jgi:hypothetical protein
MINVREVLGVMLFVGRGQAGSPVRIEPHPNRSVSISFSIPCTMARTMTSPL